MNKFKKELKKNMIHILTKRLKKIDLLEAISLLERSLEFLNYEDNFHDVITFKADAELFIKRIKDGK